VWNSIETILTKSKALQERVKAGKVKVVGAVYNIEEGTVEWIGPHPNQASLLAVAIHESHGAPEGHG
jgi:carbonic anhydrase